MELSMLIISGLLEKPTDFLIFLGRFHPLVVHLPIGFLILAVIVQFSTRWSKFKLLESYVSYLWGLGALSTLFALAFGYLLSLTGDYDESTLFWHKWIGVLVFLASSACYLLTKKKTYKSELVNWVLTTVVIISIVYTGHLGGNLTHGSTYLLEYAPNTIRTLAGMSPKTLPRPKVTVLDSADVFLDLVLPIMQSKCISCHNVGKKKGGLLLTSYDNIIRGGENGDVIFSGDLQASELFRRITLPEQHDDFMPSEGKRPLTDQEVNLLEWWIDSGAPSNGFLTQIDLEKRITAIASNYLGLDKNNLLNKKVAQPNSKLIDSLRNQGFVVNRLMKDNYYLEANFSLSQREITAADLELLLEIKEQLIWLSLSNSLVKDTHLEKIGQLENLIKLDLSKNKISNKGIQYLAKLSNLESLNLYDNQVSEGLLEIVPKMTRLNKIYLWRTGVTDTIVKRLQSENKNLIVIYNRDNIEEENL